MAKTLRVNKNIHEKLLKKSAAFFPVMLIHTDVVYVDNISHFVRLVLTDKKVSRVLVCSSIFYYSKKWIKETVLSFV